MITLSYGFKKPQSGDTGVIFWPALEDDISQLNNHTHDGVDSATLSTASIVSTTQSILAASWVLVSGGTYRQSVTMPAGLTYGQCFINFILSTLGHQIFPTVEKIDATHFYVYTNNNTLDYTAIYVS